MLPFRQDIDGNKRLLQPTPTMVRVPYRRLASSELLHDKNETRYQDIKSGRTLSEGSRLVRKKQPKKVFQCTRKPLVTLFDTAAFKKSSTLNNSDDEIKPASCSSSSSSIASSISPITPIKRHLKRLQERPCDADKDKERTIRATDMDFRKEYQQLLTKYFKAKKTIKQLKDQNIFDQKRIALLEFSRQQDTELVQLSEDTGIHESQNCFKKCSESETDKENDNRWMVDTASANNSRNINGHKITGSFKSDNSLEFITSGSSQIMESTKNNEETGINNAVQENNSYPDVSNELVKRMAAVVSHRSLRPVIFSIPNESPPCKMIQVMEKLCKSGSCCASCGKKFWKNLANDKT